MDEAHRLKSTTAQIRESIAALDIQWLLLMTGTPVQNNVRELFSLLNLLNPPAFPDEAHFVDRFGDGSDPTRMDDLRAAMKPYMLRRTKATVEKLPDKEEIIVGVRRVIWRCHSQTLLLMSTHSIVCVWSFFCFSPCVCDVHDHHPTCADAVDQGAAAVLPANPGQKYRHAAGRRQI